MMSEGKFIAILVFAGVAVFALLMGVAYWVSESACETQWQYSGYRSRYDGLNTGCLVEVSPGRWMHENVVREFGK